MPDLVPNESLPIEQFAALSAVEFCRHAFVGRVPGLDVASDKTEALRRLDAVHREVRRSLGIDALPLVTTEQVHGSEVAVVDAKPHGDQHLSGCDALITNQPNVVLGIHVADCGAVFIVDPTRRLIALIHSGKKGTELGIVPKTIAQMQSRFGSNAADLIVQLSPCIRPPHYEIDFGAEILRQARNAGVQSVHDAGVCTACELDRHYSYRAEKGRTGRMLALLAMIEPQERR